MTAIETLKLTGTRWEVYAEEAISHLRRDAVRVGMLSCDLTPGALQIVRLMARIGWVEFDKGAYRLTQAGLEATK